MEVSFLRLLQGASLCALLFVAACSRDNRPQPGATSTISPIQLTLTAEPARATAAALLPTSTPTPEPVAIGKVESVWVYADSTVQPRTCADLFADMIPVGAPNDVVGKSVECLTQAESLRVSYVRRGDGTLQLESFLLLLLFDENLPQDGGTIPDCANLVPYMLPASANPAGVDEGGNARYIGVCNYTPPARGQTPSLDMLIWARVESRLIPPDLAPDAPCWQLILYVAGDESPTVGATCRLTLA
jgi:hypothetical protein